MFEVAPSSVQGPTWCWGTSPKHWHTKCVLGSVGYFPGPLLCLFLFVFISGSLLVVLEELYVVPGIVRESAMFKASIQPAILSLYSPKQMLS